MIAVCTNPYRDIGFSVTNKAVSTLKKAGYQVSVCPVFSDSSADDLIYPKGSVELKSVAEDCTLAVAVGGDGTILSVSRELTDFNVPILGINMGTMGFLCSLSPEQTDWTDYLLKAANGELYKSSRMMLSAEVFRGGQQILVDTALNDIVIHGYGECVCIYVYVNGNLINSFNGDGIVVASPTGSTGYSMSAGGPIVDPTANNLIITPICAHSLSARSYVFSSEKEVKLIVQRQYNRRAYLASDGYNLLDINDQDIIIIRKSKSDTVLYESDETSFYSAISEKLN